MSSSPGPRRMASVVTTSPRFDVAAAPKPARRKASWNESGSVMNSAMGVCSGVYSERGHQPCTWSQAMKSSTTPDASSVWANCMANFGLSVRSSWKGIAILTGTRISRSGSGASTSNRPSPGRRACRRWWPLRSRRRRPGRSVTDEPQAGHRVDGAGQLGADVEGAQPVVLVVILGHVDDGVGEAGVQLLVEGDHVVVDGVGAAGGVDRRSRQEPFGNQELLPFLGGPVRRSRATPSPTAGR